GPAELGGGSTAASLTTASSSRGTSNQSNKFDITGKQHNGLPRRLLEARRLRGGWDVSRGHLGAVLGEIAQRVYHRVAGNSDNAGKWVVELQYYEDGARDGECPRDQSESACSGGRCKPAESQEDHNQPQAQRDQQRLRNRRNRLSLHECSKLCQLDHKACH